MSVVSEGRLLHAPLAMTIRSGSLIDAFSWFYLFFCFFGERVSFISLDSALEMPLMFSAVQPIVCVFVCRVRTHVVKLLEGLTLTLSKKTVSEFYQWSV